MKIFFTIVALIVSFGHRSAPIQFPFVGTIKILSGTKYWDGGSVAVVVTDSEMTRYKVFYRTREAGEANGGGMLTFGSKEDGNRITLEQGSEDEASLLNYLRSACVVSFGTSDPDILHESFLREGTSNSWDRMAMSTLLRQFNKEKPNKAEMATPRKPSD